LSDEFYFEYDPDEEGLDTEGLLENEFRTFENGVGEKIFRRNADGSLEEISK
jgi:hypothetical protein